MLVPVLETITIAALFIVAGSFVLIFRFEQGMLRTLGAAMGAGPAYYLVVLPTA